MMDERLGRLHFYLTFLGAYAVFLPMHFAGFAGSPRRYPDFTTFEFLGPLMPLQRWITAAAFCLAAVQLIFLWNLFHSIWRGRPAPPNPWEATSLEWSQVEGPVLRGPYEYLEDCISQNQQNPVKG
jgi:cytochrome c oxidase subunit 1